MLSHNISFTQNCKIFNLTGVDFIAANVMVDIWTLDVILSIGLFFFPVWREQEESTLDNHALLVFLQCSEKCCDWFDLLDNTARNHMMNSHFIEFVYHWDFEWEYTHSFTSFYNIVFDGFLCFSQYVQIRYPFRFHPTNKKQRNIIIIIANAISKSPFKSTFPSFCLSPKTKQRQKVTIPSEIFAEMEYFTSLNPQQIYSLENEYLPNFMSI